MYGCFIIILVNKKLEETLKVRIEVGPCQGCALSQFLCLVVTVNLKGYLAFNLKNILISKDLMTIKQVAIVYTIVTLLFTAKQSNSV